MSNVNLLMELPSTTPVLTRKRTFAIMTLQCTRLSKKTRVDHSPRDLDTCGLSPETLAYLAENPLDDDVPPHPVLKRQEAVYQVEADDHSADHEMWMQRLCRPSVMTARGMHTSRIGQSFKPSIAPKSLNRRG
ncbi:hypothetical protein Poli38472_013108 [Pythium oligandrum]|uniref:Uncharacterized protein n=1 Tax=Pythium oligandrum TaxID=41045 RepID=A0A8K1FD56_PYTOL|nr:hypothetical protein Poli38472_013108 [Pythium oligandrum]|eukprot:TMW55217.1 hypothetical protein Poli38472_013108 [Pythium oligandrum]